MVTSWLHRLHGLLSARRGFRGRLTPTCQIALNNVAQRLLIADQAVKQATQPITNRGFFETYIDRSTQLSLDHATHDYYYDKQFSSAARASADIEHNSEVLHRLMRLLRKSLRTRLKDTAEKLHSIKMQAELGVKPDDNSAGPTPASVECIFKTLDEMLDELNTSKEKAKESSGRINLRTRTEKQAELCFTQLDLAFENLEKDLGPLKQALRDAVVIAVEPQ